MSDSRREVLLSELLEVTSIVCQKCLALIGGVGQVGWITIKI